MLAPAMNVKMWLHKSTQNNINNLLRFWLFIYRPNHQVKWLVGSMEKVKCPRLKQIYEFIKNYFSDRDVVKNKNLKALVTAGPTK